MHYVLSYVVCMLHMCCACVVCMLYVCCMYVAHVLYVCCTYVNGTCTLAAAVNSDAKYVIDPILHLETCGVAESCTTVTGVGRIFCCLHQCLV